MFDVRRDVTVRGEHLKPVRSKLRHSNPKQGKGPTFDRVRARVRLEWRTTADIARCMGVRTGEVTRRVRTLARLGLVQVRQGDGCTEVRNWTRRR